MTEAADERDFMADLKHNKILYYCAGAPEVCQDCDERRKCQFFNHHIRKIVWRSLGRRALKVRDTKLPPELRRKRNRSFMVRISTLSSEVIQKTHSYDLSNWIISVTHSIVQGIPGVKWTNRSVKGLKMRSFKIPISGVLE